MAAIAVDAGTTMIKAVGYDDDGLETIVVRLPTTVNRPRPGWAEQDMHAVWTAVSQCISTVVIQLSSPVDFVAITGQGDGSWLIDDSGEPTGPAILWNDGRAGDLVERWRAEGTLAQTFTSNGSLAFAGLPNAILTWLKTHDADRLEASTSSLTCDGWLFFKMTGVRAVDSSDGAAPFMDIRARRYSADTFDAYAMPWAQQKMPVLITDQDRLRPLSVDAALVLGLPSGTPVVMGSYDIAATSIGAGAILPGQACSILGTTLCTEVVIDHIDTTGEPAGLTVGLGIEGRYLRALPTLAGGEVIQWACSMLNCSTPVELTELASRSPQGANGLIFHPYLSPAGERAPFLNPAARGSFLGLSLEHRREDLARAVLEGLTFVIRDCLEAAGPTPTELRVCGGGADNTLWLQLIADMTGIPVLKLDDTEVGARGAYLLGLTTTGAAPTIEAAVASHVRISATFAPSPDDTRFYDRLYLTFLDLRDTARLTWPLLARLRAEPPVTP
jgi:erythritol kinase